MRTITPRYRLEYRTNLLAMGRIAPDMRGSDGRPCLSQCWRGRVSVARLEDWRKGFNASMQRGGCNEHLAGLTGATDHVNFARIVRQSDGAIMAETRMPAFEVA